MPQRLLLFKLTICTLGLEAHPGDAPTLGLVTSGTYPMALVCLCLRALSPFGSDIYFSE